jgi:hypothetical protein
MSQPRNPDRLIAAYFAEPTPELPDRVFDAVRSDIHRTRQRLIVWPWQPFERPRARVVSLAAAVLLIVGLLLLNLAGFGPGGGSRTLFRSPLYGYAIPIPTGWSAAPAAVRWDGASAPSLGPNVDVIAGSHLIVLGFAGPFAGDLAAFTQDQLAAAVRDHSDTCPANPLELNEAITIGGQPGVLLGLNCGARIDQAMTVHDGIGYSFTIRDAGFSPTLDQTDLASVRSMLEAVTFPATFPTTPATSP